MKIILDSVLKRKIITFSGNKAGHVEFLSEKTDRKQAIQVFFNQQLPNRRELAKLVSILDTFKFPNKFCTVWIQELEIFEPYQGKGLSRRAIQSLCRGNPTLVMLNVGNLGTMSQVARKKIYKKLGFLIKTIGRYTYAFNFIS